MQYKEITKTKDVHGNEVVFYSTIDINQEPIIGISIAEPNIFQGVHIYSSHFSKKDTKVIIKAITERLEELEKPDNNKDGITDLEKIYDELSIRVSRSFDIIVRLEKRICELENALRSLPTHPDNKNNGKTYTYPNIPPIICKED